MPYFAPIIDATGIHVNTFTDIQNNLISAAQSIFGADIYLGNDSQDMQLIAAISKSQYDIEQLGVMVYNNMSPQNAVGTGLASLVKLNGINGPNGQTYSTCLVTVAGIVGTVITAGIVQDSSGYKWDLPVNSTIPSGGVLSITVTCETPGAILADAGTINVISTPQFGWNSVSNVGAAVPGTTVETDAALKSRQAASVALPSRTILAGIVAAVEDVPGATRVKGYENNTSSTDSNGAPANSTYIIAEGGMDSDVANAIYIKHTPGSPTYGTTTVNETDANGFVTPTKFYRPTYVPLDVLVTVKALTGYSTAVTTVIKNNVVGYLNGAQIGDDGYISSIYGAALSAQASLQAPIFSVVSVTAARHGGTLAATDIVTAFNEVLQGIIGYVNVTVT